MAKPSGYVLWEGASLLDGAPIVAIAITRSSNRKTANMVQTYIIRADIAPQAAVWSGQDASICGDCAHRGDGTGKGRTCYVNIGQGPRAVHDGYARGIYPRANDVASIPHIGEGRMVRLGTYGDPAAVPVHVWRELTRAALGHTGYTHQWRTAPLALRTLCMASVDTPAERDLAQSMGWRTFRVGSDSVGARETLCPASEEAGRKLTCNVCLACSGTSTARRGSIYIPLHGGTAVRANEPRLIARIAARDA